MDNFEWFEGYQYVLFKYTYKNLSTFYNVFRSKFGLYSVDFTDPNLPRTPKISVGEVQRIIADRQLPSKTYNSSAPAIGLSVAACTIAYAAHIVLN